MLRALTKQEEALKREYLEDTANPSGRVLSPAWEGMLRLDPEYFRASQRLVECHWRLGALSPKTSELIFLALAAHVTLLYGPGIRVHMERAAKHGATPHEVMEVLELVSVIGLHAPDLGVPILMEELRNFGTPADEEPYTEEQLQLKEYFTTTGPRPRAWAPLYEGLLRLDQAFFETMLGYIDAPWDHGALSPREKEFIYVAIDVSCTHLNEVGLRRHIQKALAEGATAEELIAVMEIAAGSGVISCVEAVPVIFDVFGEEADRVGSSVDSPVVDTNSRGR